MKEGKESFYETIQKPWEKIHIHMNYMINELYDAKMSTHSGLWSKLFCMTE